MDMLSTSSEIKVRRLKPEAEPLWEQYVAGHPQGTLFHRLVWRDAVSQSFGHESQYLTAWRGDRLVGVFPLMRVDSHLAGVILVSVPYGVYGGTLADDEEVHQALLEKAQRNASRQRVQWIDIRSVEPAWKDLPVVRRYVTFRKHLPTNPEEVLGGLPRKARAAARQARERFGLTARFDDGDLPQVWSLYSQSMRRLGSLNYPPEFFDLLMDKTITGLDTRAQDPRARRPGHLVQLVFKGGQSIAGLMSLIYGETLMPYFSGVDERYEYCHPSNFLYLSLMEKSVELGCRSFDFGRSRIDNSGSYNFKRYQGFEPMPLHYQYYVPRGGRVPDLQPGNSKLRLARRIWPRLPLAVTRPLGAWLARSIPG